MISKSPLDNRYTISASREKSPKEFFLRWEWFLLLIFILVNITNSFLSGHYLSVNGLFNATSSFLESSFLTLGMVFVLIIGEIDISVGSTVALSAVVMAESYNLLGLPMWLCLIIALLTGMLCGLLNGIILVKFPELPAMIVTLGTQILYRGIALILLRDEASGGFTNIKWFSDLYWGKLGPVPIMFIIFIVLAIIMGVILHRTVLGRRMYAIGSNRNAARYSGVRTDRIKLLVFVLMGLFCGITAIFLTSRMGSTRSNIAMGYELNAISMCVLGGVSTNGGKGTFIGAFLAIFILGFLRYGLGLINIPSQLMMVIVGLLLIVSVMIPNLNIKKRRSIRN
ncbi:MAG: ABC transporter permease [Clostridiaceae bacterium]|nr:ABC transporter permease [Clostridiaceae bacterium]